MVVKASVISLVMTLTACSPAVTPIPTTILPTHALTETASSIQTLAPTHTLEPTNTPKPTNTLRPTTTPRPTTTLAPPLAEPTATPHFISGADIAHQGVRFTCHCSGEQRQRAGAAGRRKLGNTVPAYTEFTLFNYDTRNAQFEPHLRIYPINELSGSAAETVRELKQRLAEPSAALEGEIPVLPELHAGQLIDAQIQQLRFGNGSGIRFLTQFAQNTWPINNEGLVYVFQGVTSDGAYYVSAFLPVAAPFLPDKIDNPDDVPPVDGIPFPQWSSSNFDSEYSNYRQTVTQKLNATSAQAFMPDLNALDSLLESLQVESP
jgi:hypothetical protein